MSSLSDFLFTSEQEKFVNNLSDGEKKCLTWYTSGEYREFNRKLRKKEKLTDEQNHNLKCIDSIFKKVPITARPITVYKGLDTDNISSDDAFISTTTDVNIANLFSGIDCCIIEITIPSGSRILPLKSVSLFPYENEILLDRSNYLIVNNDTSTKSYEGVKIIYMTYVSNKFNIIQSNNKEFKEEVEDIERKETIKMFIKFFYKEYITKKNITSIHNMSKIKNDVELFYKFFLDTYGIKNSKKLDSKEIALVVEKIKVLLKNRY